MEITEIHNYSFETQHEILEVEYSIQDDPQDTYREISLSKEEFDEENLKNALAEYLTLYEDELSDINHY